MEATGAEDELATGHLDVGIVSDALLPFLLLLRGVPGVHRTFVDHVTREVFFAIAVRSSKAAAVAPEASEVLASVLFGLGSSVETGDAQRSSLFRAHRLLLSLLEDVGIEQRLPDEITDDWMQCVQPATHTSTTRRPSTIPLGPHVRAWCLPACSPEIDVAGTSHCSYQTLTRTVNRARSVVYPMRKWQQQGASRAGRRTRRQRRSRVERGRARRREA